MENIGINIPPSKIIEKPEDIFGLNFPIVLKAISSKFTHKTEFGGVILNINNFNELKNGIDRLKNLKDVEKILTQEMIENKLELIIGGKIDSSFGPVVMVGAGGIFTEIIQDKAILLLHYL